jgi:hypothetical protein
VILAARGAVRAQRAGMTWQAASTVLLFTAIVTGMRAWIAWLQ